MDRKRRVGVKSKNKGLITIIVEGNLTRLAQYIRGGANVNQKNWFEQTPLMVAVDYGNTDYC